MTVPIGKVKALCTDPETNLVQASRRPAITQLSAAQLKRHRDRAKKLVDKWRDQSRKQERATSKQKGFGEKAKRSATKLQIFEDALSNFEAQLAKQEKADASGTGAPKKKAAVAKKTATKKGTKKKLPASTRKSNAAKVKAAVKKQRPKKTSKPKSTTKATTDLNLDAADRRAARAAAKKAKIDESGLTSRTKGHVSAREQRSTAARDS